MSEPQLNIRNPANWLIDVWERFPRKGEVINQTVIAGWARTFGMTNSDPRVLESISSVYAAVEQTKLLVGKLNASEKKRLQILRWHFAFNEAMVDLHNGSPWANALSRFTPERKAHLEHCATDLDDALGDAKSSKEDLQSLTTSIETLLSKLAVDESIDDEFRVLMADLFETLRRASAEYMIRGNKGVMDSLAYIFSNLLRYRDSFDTQAKKSWATELQNLLSTAAHVATVTGVNALSISGTVSGFLT